MRSELLVPASKRQISGQQPSATDRRETAIQDMEQQTQLAPQPLLLAWCKSWHITCPTNCIPEGEVNTTPRNNRHCEGGGAAVRYRPQFLRARKRRHSVNSSISELAVLTPSRKDGREARANQGTRDMHDRASSLVYYHVFG
ncbi:hypothetical protein RRG08_043757 [Elysia crispata]|uniref:Uncharacterized protein n=1 Tax=Elysia crispata TaxID=231223 RepID=A0AAE0ZQ41_9GAST|nr:hypothetical protein RRG08_043757 [Elysia crispata]